MTSSGGHSTLDGRGCEGQSRLQLLHPATVLLAQLRPDDHVHWAWYNASATLMVCQSGVTNKGKLVGFVVSMNRGAVCQAVDLMRAEDLRKA